MVCVVCVVCVEGESVRGLGYERGLSEPLTEATYRDKQLVFIDPLPRCFYLGFVLMTEVVLRTYGAIKHQ